VPGGRLGSLGRLEEALPDEHASEKGGGGTDGLEVGQPGDGLDIDRVEPPEGGDGEGDGLVVPSLHQSEDQQDVAEMEHHLEAVNQMWIELTAE
jgi:hypothetical protein